MNCPPTCLRLPDEKGNNEPYWSALKLSGARVCMPWRPLVFTFRMILLWWSSHFLKQYEWAWGEDKIIECLDEEVGMFNEQCGTMSDCVCIGLWQVTPHENREIVDGRLPLPHVSSFCWSTLLLTWSIMILPSPSSGPFMLLGDKTRSSRNLYSVSST